MEPLPQSYLSLKELIQTDLRRVEDVLTAHLVAHREIHAIEERAIEVAREELNHWKSAHNQWQQQMKDDRSMLLLKADYIREHGELSKKIVAVEHLVYIGVGLAIVFQMVATAVLGVGMAFLFQTLLKKG